MGEVAKERSMYCSNGSNMFTSVVVIVSKVLWNRRLPMLVVFMVSRKKGVGCEKVSQGWGEGGGRGES